MLHDTDIHESVDELYDRLVRGGENFWTSVYPMYMRRDISRSTVRDLVRRGLEESRGNYRIVTELFNMKPSDYKRFLNFLRKHSCQLPYKEFRSTGFKHQMQEVA